MTDNVKMKGCIQKNQDPECPDGSVYNISVSVQSAERQIEVIDAWCADYDKLKNGKVVAYDGDGNETGTYYADSWDYEDISREDANTGIGDEYDDNRL